MGINHLSRTAGNAWPKPFEWGFVLRSSRVVGGCTTTPPVNGDKQEQPDHIHKVPVPCGGLKPEVAGGCEMTFACAQPANKKKDAADKHVEAMEAGRHVEGGWEDAIFEPEGCMMVFIHLKAQEDKTKRGRNAKAQNRILVVAFQNCMVRPCDRAP